MNRGDASGEQPWRAGAGKSACDKYPCARVIANLMDSSLGCSFLGGMWLRAVNTTHSAPRTAHNEKEMRMKCE